MELLRIQLHIAAVNS